MNDQFPVTLPNLAMKRTKIRAPIRAATVRERFKGNAEYAQFSSAVQANGREQTNIT